ncbi:MAG: response regulator [Desulfuromonadaceae bacterium]|nr:response regulator [Desulfuromonadaceae bacterium]
MKPRILCVDDEPMNLSLLEAMLVPRGFELLMASNGPDALDNIERELVDVVLLDVMMPGMDGFEVCRRIKNDERYRHIPVVMITAYAARENRIRGIEAGAEDFISKPFDSAEVLARIGMLLKVKALDDQLYSAYHNITSLTNFGEQLFTGFDPFHFDFMTSISDIVRQIIAVSPEMIENPERILVGLGSESEGYTGYLFGYDAGTLAMTPLPAFIVHHLNTLVAGGTGFVWLNQADLQEQHRELLSILNEHVTTVSNLICHQSSQITLCALNYGRRVTLYDAEVLNSVVAQSLFLKSLSHQVQETEDAFAYTVHALARASEINDEDTGNHILRVGEYSALLARQLGMPEQFVALIRHQSIMHDVGKIHLSPEILKKPAPLTPEEFDLVKQHTTLGAAIIGDHVRLTLARSIALTHHERYDGSGYPFGLAGERIPIEGRILNLADQYDALRNKRCYKAAFNHDTTFRILTEGDGRTIPQHFDPRVLAAFREIHGRFAEIFAETV